MPRGRRRGGREEGKGEGDALLSSGEPNQETTLQMCQGGKIDREMLILSLIRASPIQLAAKNLYSNSKRLVEYFFKRSNNSPLTKSFELFLTF